MSKMNSLTLFLLLLAAGFSCTPYHTQGAGAGAAVGGVSGALLDDENPWHGGVIGGVLGAILRATLADVSYQASREAPIYRKPVEYRTEKGRAVYRADPLEYNARTDCKKIHERDWEDGRLVKDTIREVCEGTKYERRH